MRFSRLLSELWLKVCSNTHDKVESEQDVGMKTLIFTTAVAPTGISIYREPNQAHYVKAITDEHIRSLAHDTGLISQEAVIETGGPSAVTKATKVMMTSLNKNRNIDKLRRIMIVDDEQDVTFLFKIILEGIHQDLSFCCKVDSFNDPLVALENYREGLYDLIIIDVVMPKMDGFRLYREIRKKDKKVKVCFLTAGEMYYEEYRKHVFPEISADWVIRKPISNDDLVRKVNGYFEI